MATKVRELMTPDPVTLEASTPIRAAAERMRDDDIGNVLVEDDGQLRGIVTDRDITTRVVAEGTAPDQITLGQVCTGELHTVSPDDDLDDAVRILREHAVRRIPVTEDGTAVGVLAIGDLAVILDSDSALADISAASSPRE